LQTVESAPKCPKRYPAQIALNFKGLTQRIRAEFTVRLCGFSQSLLISRDDWVPRWSHGGEM